MSDYEVGYKKPPVHTQFKKGQSGNPNGRKKGTRNLKNDILEELSESISITENGKVAKMSKQRVIVKSLCAKAVKGDEKSIRLLTDFIMKYIENEGDEAKEDEVSFTDKEIIDRYFNRIKI
jgi:hypothetical protein